VQGAAPRAHPPVHPPQAVALLVRPQVGELEALAGRPAGVRPHRRLRPHRPGRVAKRVDPWVDAHLERRGGGGAPLAQPERLTDADPGRDDEPAPAFAVELELHLARSRPGAHGPPRRASRRGEAGGDAQRDVHLPQPAGRRELDGRRRPVALEPPQLTRHEPRGHLGRRRSGEPDRGDQSERRRNGHELRPAQPDRREEQGRADRRIRAEPDRGGGRHGSVTASARGAGAGTRARQSCTTSSPDTRCTQSSGRSVSR
jgi:hypothetical protein